jgi:hypothetical protein
MSRFVVTLNAGKLEQRNAITALIQAKGWPLWHHFEDVWMIANVPDDISSKALYEEFESISVIGDHSLLVLKVEGDPRLTHWGRTNKEGWVWMKKFWGTPE